MYGQHQYSTGLDYGGPSTVTSQNNEQASSLKDSIGSAWQGVIGFGNRTKAVVGQATETVVQSASQVTENVGTTGLGK